MTNPNQFFDDISKVAGGALSGLDALRKDIEASVRAKTEHWAEHAGFVRRAEFEELRAIVQKLREEQEAAKATSTHTDLKK
jgi:BMFP domain-containing protein YqiC